jgi:hypothetical protein
LLERVTGRGEDMLASCPVPSHGQGNGDRHPSLSVGHKDGKVLLNCMGGCHVQDVMLALGLDWPDLFDDEYKADKWELLATWPYQRPDGVVHFNVERWRRSDGSKFYTQRVPGYVDEHGKPKAGYPNGFKPCLYNLPAVLRQAQAGGEVWIVEGEKCVSAATRLGLVATTAPNGSGKWQDYYASWLRGASVVNVVIDNDESGKHHGSVVTASLRGRGLRVKTWQVKNTDDKADLYDHVLAGYGVDDLIPINLNRLRPQGVEAKELLSKEFPPIKWSVEGLMSSGLALLGGPPKMSKSMVALDMALGVAMGGRAMSELTCHQGSVLYLSLDNDSERRLADRVRYLMHYQSGHLPIEFHVDWPTGEEAVAGCREWVNETRDAGQDPRLIVVDTLVKVEPQFEGNGVENSYATSTNVLSRWAKFAAEADVSVLAVHHDRKARDDTDWLNRFTGSRGITATAQTLMMLDVKRGEKNGWLRVTGRDIETDDLELRRFGWTWVALAPPSGFTPEGVDVVERDSREATGAGPSA